MVIQLGKVATNLRAFCQQQVLGARPISAGILRETAFQQGFVAPLSNALSLGCQVELFTETTAGGTILRVFSQVDPSQNRLPDVFGIGTAMEQRNIRMIRFLPPTGNQPLQPQELITETLTALIDGRDLVPQDGLKLFSVHAPKVPALLPMPAEGPFPIGGWKPLLAGFRSEDAAVLIGLFRRRVAPFYPQSVIDNCFLIPMMAAAARWSDKQGYPHASLALIKELFTLPLTDMRTAKLLEELARLYHCRKISLSQINTLTRSLADFDHETGRRNTKAVAKICESLLTRFEITSLVDFARLPGLIMGIAFHLAGENPEEVAGRDLSTAVKLGKMVIETLPIKCEDKKIVRSVKNFIHLALTIDFEQGLELMHAAFEKQLFNRTNFNYLVKDFITLLEADSERFAKLVPRFIDAIIAEEPLTSEDRDFIAAEFSYLAQSYCGIVHDQSMHRENPKAAWIIYLALLRNPLLSDDARLHIEQNIIRAASSKNSVFTEAAALADLKPEESKYSAALIAHLIFSNRTHPNHADRCLAFIEASPFRSEAIFIGTILQAMNVKKQYREAIALADRFLASWQPQTYNEKRFIYLGVQRHKVKLLLSQAASNTNGHKADLLNEALGCFRMMMQYAETENLVSAFSAKTLMMGVETLDRLNRVPEAVEAAIKLAHDFPLFYPARDYLASHPISSRP